MGWIIPYSWQEPDYFSDSEPEEGDDGSDFDDEGVFTL